MRLCSPVSKECRAISRGRLTIRRGVSGSVTSVAFTPLLLHTLKGSTLSSARDQRKAHPGRFLLIRKYLNTIAVALIVPSATILHSRAGSLVRIVAVGCLSLMRAATSVGALTCCWSCRTRTELGTTSARFCHRKSRPTYLELLPPCAFSVRLIHT